MLKTTYRLDRSDHGTLYDSASAVCDALGLDVEVTCYQSGLSGGLNASITCPLGEAHIVFTGNLLGLLSPEELRAVLGHELAHRRLWAERSGRFKVADQLIHAAATDFRADAVHEQSARLWQLYTEFYADRGAWIATGDLGSAIAELVKVATGLPEVSGASYLRQANDVFAKEPVLTQGLSHPETFIRARALALWVENHPDVDEEIEAMIEGAADWDHLDIIAQIRLTALTKRLLEKLLLPDWFQPPRRADPREVFFPRI